EGATVTPLTAALRSRYGLPETVTGVIVTAVERGTPAAEAGLQAGLLISRAGSRTVNSAADLAAAVQQVKAAGRPSILLFVTDGRQRGTLVLKFAAD
ncbi:MAG: PDZ domain-containing protein, partial [Brevundimonas sp.]|nr:PDZ domain-containing protein [Brevundimonas sp.]